MATLPEFTSVDYLSEATSRLTQQFMDKEVVNRYLQLIIDEQYEIQTVFKELLQKRSIDTAEGATLDIIGNIVGQPRELISVDLFDFFGYQGATKSGSYGDVDDLSVGSRWYSFGAPLGGNSLLDDDTYRLFIKAKILKNTTASTPEQFISFINFLFGTDSSVVVNDGNAAFTILFGRELTPFEQSLLNYVSTSQGYPSRLIPKTVGVRINFGYFDANNFFGYQGAPNASGYGDLTGTHGYGLGYGANYGESDISLVGGGKFATLI